MDSEVSQCCISIHYPSGDSTFNLYICQVNSTLSTSRCFTWLCGNFEFRPPSFMVSSTKNLNIFSLDFNFRYLEFILNA